MATAARRNITLEEYLARERKAETKSEYYHGEVFAMTGATREHNLIVGNLVGEIRSRLRQTPCEVYPSDMRVRVPSGLYTYPDVTIVCGQPSFLESERKDTLLNPLVLIEVLSESTEARGKKFEHYRGLAALREYLLVSTTEPRIERYQHLEDKWLLDDVAGLEATLRLTAVDLELPLAEVYARVEFPEQPPLHGPNQAR
jgi:Uma2 family endonuclease